MQRFPPGVHEDQTRANWRANIGFPFFGWAETWSPNECYECHVSHNNIGMDFLLPLMIKSYQLVQLDSSVLHWSLRIVFICKLKKSYLFNCAHLYGSLFQISFVCCFFFHSTPVSHSATGFCVHWRMYTTAFKGSLSLPLLPPTSSHPHWFVIYESVCWPVNVSPSILCPTSSELIGPWRAIYLPQEKRESANFYSFLSPALRPLHVDVIFFVFFFKVGCFQHMCRNSSGLPNISGGDKTTVLVSLPLLLVILLIGVSPAAPVQYRYNIGNIIDVFQSHSYIIVAKCF